MKLAPIDIDDSILDEVCLSIAANFGWSDLTNEEVLSKTRELLILQAKNWVAAGKDIRDKEDAKAALQAELISKIT